MNTTCMRELDIHKDLPGVADLIELCFSEQMDQDGREYVHQIRKLARDIHYLGIGNPYLRPPVPNFAGLVWEEDGRLVGNLTLISFRRGSQKVYLIANVATHPDYRRRGIGRSLTARALQIVRDRGAESAWLQVRQDNQAAHQLYLDLGFLERTVRTTWLLDPPARVKPERLNGDICKVTARDWPQAVTWFDRIYPPLVSWNLPFDQQRFRPGWWNALLRAFNGERLEQWAYRADGKLMGVLSWEPSRTSSDLLWLATPPDSIAVTTRYLLPYALSKLSPVRPLSLNLPADVDGSPLREIGFIPQSTLIWMEAPSLNQN